MASSIVGNDALIRASEVTLPFLTGTLRSERINKRFPFRSRSCILMIDMRLPLINIKTIKFLLF